MSIQMKFSDWVKIKESFDSPQAEIHSQLDTIRQTLQNMLASAHMQNQNWGHVMNLCTDLMKNYPQFKQLKSIRDGVERIAYLFRDYARILQHQGSIPLKNPQTRQQYEEIMRQVDPIHESIQHAISDIYKQMQMQMGS